MTASPTPRRAFGFWICLALVMGNMIGSGFFLMPASLAPFGWNGAFGWVATTAGALCLAVIFGSLAHAFPKAGGAYAYTRQAFGPTTAFVVAWSYWVSMWVGNAAIATGLVAPLATLFPSIIDHSAIVTIAIVWMVTGINCFSALLTGRVQLLTTILKFAALVAVVLLAALVIGRSGGEVLPPIRLQDLGFGGETGIAAAAALTLWSFLGLESATVPAERVKDPSRTIPRATLAGTAITGCIYLFACSAVALLLPVEQVVKSGAPMADFVALYWGPFAGTMMAAAAVVSAFGALNGWVLLQGEMPWAMAKDGVFPRFLAKTSSRGTPLRAHIVASLLVTLVISFNFTRSIGDLFQFLILLATSAALVVYLACSVGALRLARQGRLPAGRARLLVFLLAALFSCWALYGAGVESLLWGMVLLLSGIPIHFLMRRNLPPGETVSSLGPDDQELNDA
ncbi:APC family permease [Sphingosinicella rhizophila]|uniref:Arginine/agmatine antiporter n=1 Tax=Sphingosinicella rhizophila TaxID=3050082 RepID=A0ABU3Q830_9SPHN|nr:amino acid permease [Sphingosinicella sp. GR2756]MDT9599536.1 amino acid permease [Sphingosinicella sp. GR2756]